GSAARTPAATWTAWSRRPPALACPVWRAATASPGRSAPPRTRVSREHRAPAVRPADREPARSPPSGPEGRPTTIVVARPTSPEYNAPHRVVSRPVDTLTTAGFAQ